MKFSSLLITLTFGLSSLYPAEQKFPPNIQKIMDQPKYRHGIWGLYVKDLDTGKVLYDLNSHLLFSPASTSKLFSMAALLDAYGDAYRFKTPVYAVGPIKKGILQGDLVLVAQGDLTMGGRQSSADTITYTKMDHITANDIPGTLLSPENPLYAFEELAKQVAATGIKEITGDVLIDDSLFQTTEKRGMILSPIMVNENLIDCVLNPSEIGKIAHLDWRPQVPKFSVRNEVQTVAKGEALSIEVTADATGQNIVIKGTLPADAKDVVRTSNISNPVAFARAAFVQALHNHGIRVQLSHQKTATVRDRKMVAEWVSPPLSEYVKLILKVSHNLGANLTPLLLAAKEGKKTFDDGMLLLGDFLIKKVKLSADSFVLIDGAGGNENRLTPRDEITLLEYMYHKSPSEFKDYFDALPILGVDGSLEDFAKKTPGAGKVRAKPGTGVAFNLATHQFFLITQALGGYIEAKNGHLLAYMVVINNGTMPQLDDIFPIFEDISVISSLIYEVAQK